jgi:hypothetical protein
MYPPPYHHGHHDRGRRVGVGSFIGGVVGGLIGSQIRPAPPPPPRHDDDDELFERAMHFVAEAPEGAEVRLTMDEFRAVTDRDMIKYEGIVPYCLKRQISVVSD